MNGAAWPLSPENTSSKNLALLLFWTGSSELFLVTHMCPEVSSVCSESPVIFQGLPPPSNLS